MSLSFILVPVYTPVYVGIAELFSYTVLSACEHQAPCDTAVSNMTAV